MIKVSHLRQDVSSNIVNARRRRASPGRYRTPPRWRRTAHFVLGADFDHRPEHHGGVRRAGSSVSNSPSGHSPNVHRTGGTHRGRGRRPAGSGAGTGGSGLLVFVEASPPVQVEAGLSAYTPVAGWT